jgi:hypothetical protein
MWWTDLLVDGNHFLKNLINLTDFYYCTLIELKKNNINESDYIFLRNFIKKNYDKSFKVIWRIMIVYTNLTDFIYIWKYYEVTSITISDFNN